MNQMVYEHENKRKQDIQTMCLFTEEWYSIVSGVFFKHHQADIIIWCCLTRKIIFKCLINWKHEKIICVGEFLFIYLILFYQLSVCF